MTRSSAVFAILLGVLAGCGPCDKQREVGIADEIFADRLGGPARFASEGEREVFRKGRELVNKEFTTEEGLGPSFNVASCGGCHEQPTAGGASPRYRNFFLLGDSEGGFSTVEASVPISGSGRSRKTVKQGVQTQFGTSRPHRNPTPANADVVATRNTIPFFGIGALAEVPARIIRKNADPDDRNDDGISGRVHTDLSGRVGRFGRKAQTASLEGFVRGPMFNHLGLTNNELPESRADDLPIDIGGEPVPTETNVFESREQAQAPPPEEGGDEFTDEDGVPDPELSEDQVFRLVAFTMLLGAPEPEEPTERTKRGRQLFESIGCADCHVPTLRTHRGKVPAYTDLLLHDMGSELADGFAQGDARGSEFRTQPLWGLAATEPYLHDGRADTIDEAIRYHGGEAERSRKNYEDLSDGERTDLLAFLRSLGGADRDSPGLIEPDEEMPTAEETGGPVEGLSDAELDKFRRGRRLFDRDMSMGRGLGPKFNGDSCRGCHSKPAVGGAGPVGVNVSREGHFDPHSESFEAPEDGTLLHRFTTDPAARPTPAEDSNVFELRQPPPLFGLGLIDEIPAETIEAGADPDDEDGDGISGRVARPDGEGVGRFGWKGAFTSLEDFVRDALTNEEGMTVPEVPHSDVGRTEDDDGVGDPEFSGQDYTDLLFYSRKLGPPERPDSLSEEAQRGEALFDELGCADCHTPSMETEDGREVHLYSDLLLHRVAPEDYRGVGAKDAGPREFRTPPLWGVGETGPYMHDGLAATLEEAIGRHAGEASGSARAFEELSSDEKTSLIEFLESI